MDNLATEDRDRSTVAGRTPDHNQRYYAISTLDYSNLTGDRRIYALQ